jgi:hypothetical protein
MMFFAAICCVSKKENQPSASRRIRATTGQSASSSKLNRAIGKQLQIVSLSPSSGGGSTTAYGANFENAKPTFKAMATNGGVILNWTKADFDGVQVEAQRGNETAWTMLDKDFKSPFIDARPNLVANQPEQRRYRMIYLLNDQIVGAYSDTINVNTA